VNTLRGRLFAATLAALGVTLALTIAIGAVLTRRQVDRTQVSALAVRADDLAEQRRQNPSYINQNRLSGNVRIIVQPRSLFVPYVPDVNRNSDGTTTYDGSRYLYSYRTIPSRGLLVLRLASQRAAEWRPFLRDLLFAALAGAALAATLSFLIARSITTPIRRVAAATRAFATNERHEPLPVEGTREIASLAAAFNDMSQQLTASREAERNFLLSVSHELKTPLTAIRGYAEAVQDGAFDPQAAAATVASEARRLERLVHDLLDLARMHRTDFSVLNTDIDLAEVVDDVVRRYQQQAETFEVSLVAAGDTRAPAVGDADRVLQVASNLVENALRLTPPGGEVRVVAAPGILRVEDTGPGLAENDTEHAFERFYLYERYGRERPVGTGLGLAIVKELTLAMGGSVDVESRPGRLTVFTVRLRVPVAARETLPA
jgi:two-component system sensor histidine kinase BaeS